MPELPEVETTLQGICPYVLQQTISQVNVRIDKLRWPIDKSLPKILAQQQFTSISRRGKYLLLQTPVGTLLLHLGMSGSIRIVKSTQVHQKHDHFEICFNNGNALRLKDPRRFGAVLWTTEAIEQHPLIARLGPEPLGSHFNGQRLYTISRNKKQTVKQFIMDSTVVVGVGNIYANEALFMAGLRPGRAAGGISSNNYQLLADAIKNVLLKAIAEGGTTLKDFSNIDGSPGYFKQHLNVYGRAGQPCRSCGIEIKGKKIGQRSSYYCPACQH